MYGVSLLCRPTHGKLECIPCKGKEAIVIPDGVKEISTYAFFACKDVASVVVPSTVTKIGKHVCHL